MEERKLEYKSKPKVGSKGASSSRTSNGSRKKASVTVFPARAGNGLQTHDIHVEELPANSKFKLKKSPANTAPVTDTQAMPTISDSMLAEVLRLGSVATAGKVFTRLPKKANTSGLASIANNTEVVVLKGRFELESLLGVGGMGTVYRALDRRRVEAGDPDPYVAIKLVNDDLRSNPDAFACLQQETRKTQKLSHAHIATVYDFDCDDDLFFMVMELMEGVSSDRVIKKRPCGLDQDTASSMIRDISSALIHAHKRNIIHSDIKPSNIFVSDTNQAKLFDFGNACALLGQLEVGASLVDDVKDVGRLGNLTPAYASFEMLKGEEPSYSDDVYSLACVAYELLTGVHPFDKTPADLAFNRNLKVKRIDGLPRKQMRALERALVFKRKGRTKTIEAFYTQFFEAGPSLKPLLHCATASALTALLLLIVQRFI